MAHCPAYQGPICSLCCTLDARCGDLCKPHASLSALWSGALRTLLPRPLLAAYHTLVMQEQARLPVKQYPNIMAWYERVRQLDVWKNTEPVW